MRLRAQESFGQKRFGSEPQVAIKTMGFYNIPMGKGAEERKAKVIKGLIFHVWIRKGRPKT